MRRIATGILLLLLAFSTTPARAGDLEATFHDVGQGLGVSLRTPSGKWIVYDMGPDNEAGERMADDLAARGCTEIAAVVVSHPHLDHLGGFGPIFARFRVHEVLDAGVAYTTRSYRAFLDAVEREDGCRYRIPSTGDTLSWDPALAVTVLHSDSTPGREVNNASIVLRIRHNRSTLILTGDAEKEVEAEMVSDWGPRGLHAGLLQIGHHGSHSSTTAGFLDAVHPETGVISCGTGNSYHHPHPETIDRLAHAGVACARTDLEGTIRFRSDGTRWRRVGAGGDRVDP